MFCRRARTESNSDLVPILARIVRWGGIPMIVPAEGKMKKASIQIGLGILLGAGLAAAAAVAIGSGGMWLAVGVAVGVAIGATMFRKSSSAEKANDHGLRTNN